MNKAQGTFPVIIIAVATVIFAILLVYSIVNLTGQPPTEENNSTDSPDSSYDEFSLLSTVQQMNDPNCPIDGPDTDGDGIVDECDNCIYHFNPMQEDSDYDGKGDMCDYSSQNDEAGEDEDDDDGDDGDGEEPEIVCEDNSDCGTDGFVDQPFCSGDDVVQTYISYTCNNPGDEDSSCSQSSTNQLIEDCNETCENGQCVPFPLIECSVDSDCGTDGYVGETFCSGDDVARDYVDYTCNNPGTEQSFCESTTTQDIVQQCDDTCEDGACTTQGEIECFQDTDCGIDGFIDNPFCLDLSIFRTFETFTCNNPGTEQSVCSSTQEEIFQEECSDACVDGSCATISCTADLECGEDSYVGDQFCLGDDIFQMFEEFMCVFPGLPGSYCASEATPTFIDTCDYACLSGECIRCDENSDCSDGNPNTQDTCVLPATPFSYCENSPICENECVDGERVCDGNGYRICGNFDSDSCTEWSTRTQCSYGQVCIDGTCILDEPSCQDECTYGERACDGNGYRICGNFDSDSCTEWSTLTQCSFGQVCIDGACN